MVRSRWRTTASHWKRLHPRLERTEAEQRVLRLRDGTPGDRSVGRSPMFDREAMKMLVADFVHSMDEIGHELTTPGVHRDCLIEQGDLDVRSQADFI